VGPRNAPTTAAVMAYVTISMGNVAAKNHIQVTRVKPSFA